MWECSYAKEPFDLKLLVIQFVYKIWIPILAALLGAAIFGGGYYLKNVTFGEVEKFQQTSRYYVEYGMDPVVGNEYTYINAATWNAWVTTDLFVDMILDNSDIQKYSLTKADLQEYLSADLQSDLRIPTSTVITESKELTEKLGNAVEEAFRKFGEEQKEIVKIDVVDTSGVTQVKADVRTFRAIILGGCIGLFFSLAILLIYFVADDSILVQGTFSYRYGIPMLGIVYSTLDCSEELNENMKYVIGDSMITAITAVEPEIDLAGAAEVLSIDKYVCIPSVLQVPEAAGKLREADKVILFVEAGAHNGKRIEAALHYLKVQDCKVDGAILYNGNKALVTAYNFSVFRRK